MQAPVEPSASKRVLKNFGIVLRGRGIAAVFTLAATALMAHALSAIEFGLVILLHTYVLAVRGFLNFRTYEAIVRFGVPLHENDDKEEFIRGLLKGIRESSERSVSQDDTRKAKQTWFDDPGLSKQDQASYAAGYLSGEAYKTPDSLYSVYVFVQGLLDLFLF